MSLIEEALRRLQDPSLPATEQASRPARPPPQAGAVKPAPAPPTPSTPASQPAPIHPWSTAASSASTQTPAPRTTSVLIALVAAILLLTIALLVGGAWWIGRTLKTGTRPVSSANETAVSQSATPDPEPLPLQTTTPAPRALPLAISGIVEGEGQPYAVINGVIVAVGERIGEFTLEEVAHGAARLRRADGSEVVLRVPR